MWEISNDGWRKKKKKEWMEVRALEHNPISAFTVCICHNLHWVVPLFACSKSRMRSSSFGLLSTNSHIQCDNLPSRGIVCLSSSRINRQEAQVSISVASRVYEVRTHVCIRIYIYTKMEAIISSCHPYHNKQYLHNQLHYSEYPYQHLPSHRQCTEWRTE